MPTTASLRPLQIQPRVFVVKNNLDKIFNDLSSQPVSDSNITTRERSFDTVLCAPYPPCHPLGCGRDKAPIDCEGCDDALVVVNILGMCLLAILIVFANVLVIVIIMRTESLRLRHGLIKVSLAVSDLLIGLFVIPAAAYNLATTMYFPSGEDSRLSATGRFWKPTSNQTPEFVQKNTIASIFFGTILIISLTSSIYNLLLLSVDRFFSVAKPLQSRSEKYFSKKRVKICIIIVWAFGAVISALPACIPSRFSYQLDGTTFFYVQVASFESDQGVGPIALFSLFVMGLPYIAIVTLNLSTMFVTMKKLKFSKNLNNNEHIKSIEVEQVNRMKLIMKTSPEMQCKESMSDRARKWFSRSGASSVCSSDQAETTTSSAISQTSSMRKSADRMNARVTKMIISMVVAFTVCVCPYVIVNALLYNGSLDCSNLGVVYNVVIYLLLLNSAMNFFIYNFWHKEFRTELIASLTRKPATSSGSPSTHNAIMTSSGNRRFHSGKKFVPGQPPIPQYQMGKMGGVSSFQEAQPAKDTGL